MGAAEAIAKLGLPALPLAGGNYVPAKAIGSLIFPSGVVSADESGTMTGTAGVDQSVDQAYAAARA